MMIMEKKELGKIHTISRNRKGIDQKIKIYNEKQKQIIIEAVENRPESKTVEDVIKLYDINPAVYYSWVRSDSGVKKSNYKKIPNPLADTLEGSNVFSSSEELQKFYEQKSPELREFIKNKFQEWLEHNLIEKITSKINDVNINEVAKAGTISVEDLNDYLAGKKTLSYFSIDGIRRFLQIK
jgi:hypothetical protein